METHYPRLSGHIESRTSTSKQRIVLGTPSNNRGLYVANSFLPPVSKFMIGFDLVTFPNQSDVARSGKYLGNGPLTLVMSGCNAPSLASVSTNASTDTYYAIAVVLFDIRFSIMAGGQLLSYY